MPDGEENVATSPLFHDRAGRTGRWHHSLFTQEDGQGCGGWTGAWLGPLSWWPGGGGQGATGLAGSLQVWLVQVTLQHGQCQHPQASEHPRGNPERPGYVHSEAEMTLGHLSGSVVRGLQRGSVRQQVLGWMLHQGANPGRGFDPQLAQVEEATDGYFSLAFLSVPPPMPLGLKSIKKQQPLGGG